MSILIQFILVLYIFFISNFPSYCFLPFDLKVQLKIAVKSKCTGPGGSAIPLSMSWYNLAVIIWVSRHHRSCIENLETYSYQLLKGCLLFLFLVLDELCRNRLNWSFIMKINFCLRTSSLSTMLFILLLHKFLFIYISMTMLSANFVNTTNQVQAEFEELSL